MSHIPRLKVPKANDALFLDMSTGKWKEEAMERMGGVVEVLEETKALPVSTEDGLLHFLWPPPEITLEISSKVVQPSNKEPSAEEPSAEVQKFGEGALLFGRRMTVRGNGSCWLYAVMAALGVLQHANPRPLRGCQQEMIPTNADYELSALFLSKMKVEIASMKLQQDDVKDVGKKAIATKKAPMCKCWGGGPTDYACLSYMLQCNILVLDQSNPNKTTLYTGHSRGRNKSLDADALKLHLEHAVEHEEPNLVVEFNGDHTGAGGHFAAYESPASYMPEQPQWLKSALAERPRR